MKNFLALLIVVTVVFSCSKGDTKPADPGVTDTTSVPIASPASENFESGTKSDYTSSSITLATGKWNFDNAVIGSDPLDKKNGSKAARIQETGKLSMNFDVVNGVFIVSIVHATYGTDGASTWQLWASTNSGSTYSQLGSTITSTAAPRLDSFIVNFPSKVRFQIRKISGGSNRLNIDDIKFIRAGVPPPPSTTDNDHMLMGNPSLATFSPLDYFNYLMVKPYYALSYNRDQGKANWVSWHLFINDLGTTERQDFAEDPNLPASWYRVTNSSYTGGGFDRGHTVPSGDRTANLTMNVSTFLMTNIMPQAPQMNQRTWAQLEDSARRLVQSGNELYIISGSYGRGGTGNNGYFTTIDNGNVTVPAMVWKVIVVIPNANNDLSRISTSTRVIAVNVPNDNSVNTNWKTYRTTVNEIENEMGNNFNLLSNLPQAVQDVVEARTDNL
jgi:endonuclease G